ncbi:hypothetical protein E2C01_065735 [Portunus trituberculatus]|uniref:Uncharacterized protein n=1 Tax=Portunus trituberculatus TaxID=210409 RepID=A0A5B7HRY6_PORTR|nr:hypothetical protein [Portunus trituberculatus]
MGGVNLVGGVGVDRGLLAGRAVVPRAGRGRLAGAPAAGVGAGTGGRRRVTTGEAFPHIFLPPVPRRRRGALVGGVGREGATVEVGVPGAQVGVAAGAAWLAAHVVPGLDGWRGGGRRAAGAAGGGAVRAGQRVAHHIQPHHRPSTPRPAPPRHQLHASC